MSSESHYSSAEIEEFICNLNHVDKIKLLRLLAHLGPERVGWEPDDLLQQTMTDLLEGRRSWPRKVEKLVFIKNAARSILSNHIEKRKYELSAKHETLDGIDTLNVSGNNGSSLAEFETNDRDARIRHCIQSICSLFDPERDADVLCLLNEKLNNANKQAVMALCKLTELMYQAAIKKLKYRVRKAFPNGLKFWEVTL